MKNKRDKRIFIRVSDEELKFINKVIGEKNKSEYIRNFLLYETKVKAFIQTMSKIENVQKEKELKIKKMFEKEKKSNRNKRITLRLNDFEHKMLEEKSKFAGKTQSDLIRNLIVDGKVTVKKFENMLSLSREINKIGTNINQIAHRVNETKSFYENDIKVLKNNMDEIKELFNKYLEKND